MGAYGQAPSRLTGFRGAGILAARTMGTSVDSSIPLFASFGLTALLSACSGSSANSSASTPPPAAGAGAATVASQARAIGGCSAPASGEEMRTSDVDDNGNPEVCKYYRTIDDPERPGQRKSMLARMTLDVNGDGKTDIERNFAADGLVVQESWDTDFDGRVDEVRSFEEGKITRAERDQDNDGRMEVIRFYDDGKLERKEVDTNGDGKPDRWEYFKRREDPCPPKARQARWRLPVGAHVVRITT
ncbi:MAG: hypothetical protein AAFZ18_33315, partial [Myxococcota bacterium]